jgi:hypothetical protein
MYSTTKLPTLLNCLESLSITNLYYVSLYLNYLTCYYFNIKKAFNLPSKPIILANSKATRLLLKPLTLNARPLINALVE